MQRTTRDPAKWIDRWPRVGNRHDDCGGGDAVISVGKHRQQCCKSGLALRFVIFLERCDGYNNDQRRQRRR